MRFPLNSSDAGGATYCRKTSTTQTTVAEILTDTTKLDGTNDTEYNIQSLQKMSEVVTVGEGFVEI